MEIPLDPSGNPKTIIDNNLKWRVLESEEEIRVALMKQNQKHFGQAESGKTTFFTEPLVTDINYTATLASVESILEGEFNNKEVNNFYAVN